MENQSPKTAPSEPAQKTAQDKRNAPRLEIARQVFVLAADGARIPCKLSDVSKSGARLTVDDTKLLPDEFEVLLKDDLRKWCRVMRRSDKDVGIKFIAAPKPAKAEAAAPSIAPDDAPADATQTAPSAA